MPKRKQRDLPNVGMVFNKVFKKKKYQMKVTRAENGVRYEVSNREYPSPTAAAKSITHTDVNGWVFWKITDS